MRNALTEELLEYSRTPKKNIEKTAIGYMRLYVDMSNAAFFDLGIPYRYGVAAVFSLVIHGTATDRSSPVHIMDDVTID